MKVIRLYSHSCTSVYEFHTSSVFAYVCYSSVIVAMKIYQNVISELEVAKCSEVEFMNILTPSC